MVHSIFANPSQSVHDALQVIQPSDVFWGTIHRERLIVDRYGGCVSLIIFTPTEPAHLNDLVGIVRRQVRLTDAIGWFGKGRLGVILPATPDAGARRVAEKVCEDWDLEALAPRYELYTYPTEGPDAASRAWVEDAGYVTAEQVKTSDLQTLLVQPLPFWKRTLDVVGAVVGLVLLSPLMLATALAIRLTSRGPVIFRQERAGLGGRPFTMYKFRSMVVDAEERKAALARLNEQDGPAFKMKHDPRVTRVGRFIRSTSIDELPQLFNVLKGEMTLVGPRPLPVDESRECEGWHRNRLDVTPGLTCIWQVEGKNRVTFTEWNRMDVRYLRRRSLAHDLVLIVRTAWVVMQRRG